MLLSKTCWVDVDGVLNAPFVSLLPIGTKVHIQGKKAHAKHVRHTHRASTGIFKKYLSSNGIN